MRQAGGLGAGGAPPLPQPLAERGARPARRKLKRSIQCTRCGRICTPHHFLGMPCNTVVRYPIKAPGVGSHNPLRTHAQNIRQGAKTDTRVAAKSGHTSARWAASAAASASAQTASGSPPCLPRSTPFWSKSPSWPVPPPATEVCTPASSNRWTGAGSAAMPPGQLAKSSRPASPCKRQHMHEIHIACLEDQQARTAPQRQSSRRRQVMGGGVQGIRQRGA